MSPETRRRLESCGILPTEAQEQSRLEMQAMLVVVLADVRHASMSWLITFANPDIIGKSASEDASPTWVGDALTSILAELDRRFPIPPDEVR